MSDSPKNPFNSAKKDASRVRILGIETSCDETSVAILEAVGDEVTVLHHEISTQIPIHQKYGGVVPEVAARTHVAELVELLERAGVFKEGNEELFDAVAVTQGPGLATALRVGIEGAKTISVVTGKPIIGVNHLEGHLASAWLMPENRSRWQFPVLALLVSGGHTELVLMKDFSDYEILGRTRDDAAGEAFDKSAKLIGLSYPGGPAISKLALDGDSKAFAFPRPMLHDGSFDFSFSGLKTAVRTAWLELSDEQKKDAKILSDFCASLQAAIVDVLVEKTLSAARASKPTGIIIVGGVSANAELQRALREAVETRLEDVVLLDAARGFHTDNAAMIAAAGIWKFRQGKVDEWEKVEAKPEWDL